MLGNYTLIVDGYNVANNWLEAGFLKPGDLESSRQQLINHLSNLAGYLDIKCLLIFDAHLVKGNEGSIEHVNSFLDVVFTCEGQTADTLIERLTDDLRGEGKDVVVCTSDWAEQNIAFTRGASRQSARELLRHIKKVQAEMSNKYGRYPKSWQPNWLEDSLPAHIREALAKMRDK